jgi:hypothetical protein
MFGFRLMMRLGSAALRWLQGPPARRSRSRPSRIRLSLEPLSDRLLPSVDLSKALVAPDSAQMRFAELPQSESWQTYLAVWGLPVSPHQMSQEFPLSSHEMSQIVGDTPGLEQLGPPSMTGGTVELCGETLPVVVLQFGSSFTLDLAFCTDVASRPAVVGGLVAMYSDGGERHFLMYNSGVESKWQGTPLLREVLSLADVRQDAPSVPEVLSLANVRPTIGGVEPTNTAPSVATTGPSVATFLAGWSGGKQIADGLAEQAANDTRKNGTAEVAVNDPGNPADLLLTVDTVLPNAKADLVRLQQADLAIVPTYLVGDAPVAPVAPPRGDERPDLGLPAHVVGLDESPGAVSGAPVSTDPLFELLASADGGRGVEARRLLADAEARPDGSEVSDAPAAAPTAAGLALRRWLDGLLNQGGNGAKVIAAMAMEGLLVAYLYRQRLTSRVSNSCVRNHGGQVGREDPIPLASTPGKKRGL